MDKIQDDEINEFVGIVIGIGAYIYNIQEEKKQQELSAKYTKE